MNFSEFDVTRRTRKGDSLNQIDDPIETVCKNKKFLVIDLTPLACCKIFSVSQSDSSQKQEILSYAPDPIVPLTGGRVHYLANYSINVSFK